VRPDPRGRLAGAEAAHARFLEDIVAGEDLVCSFARQDHFQPGVADQPGQLKKRSRGGADDRPFGEADHLWKDARYVAFVTGNHSMLSAKGGGHLLLVGAFVVFGAVEGDRERLETLRRHAGGKCRDQRGVQPARKVGADGYVGAHAQFYRVGQKRAQFLCRLGFAGDPRRSIAMRKVELPVGPDAGAALLDGHQPAGLEFIDVAEGGARRDGRPQRENLVERDRVDFGRNPRHLEQRLYLRGEIERSVPLRVEERSHAHAVAGQHHAPLPLVPQREGEIAVEKRQAVFTHLVIEVQDDFGIAGCAEAPAPGPQLVAQLDIVEDFAVEGDGQLPGLVRHRLLAIAQPDDGEPRMAEPCAGSYEFALLVGAAMRNRRGHLRQQRVRVMHMADVTSKSAHASSASPGVSH
jgi:hypothetical protein